MTTTPEANGAPLDSWQSVQWQLIIARGFCLPVNRIERHAQPPEKEISILCFLVDIEFTCNGPSVCRLLLAELSLAAADRLH